MLEESGLYYPNRIARHFLVAMEQVMGRSGLEAILNLAHLHQFSDQLPANDLAREFDFVYLSAVSEALEEMYGARGGRSMALRIGRACFGGGLKSFGAMGGMAHPSFQQLSLDERSRLGLDALAAIFTKFSDQHSEVADIGEYYTLTTEYSPFSWNRSSDKPVCHALVGIIQESMRWASNGYEFHVQEISCRATGDEACVFRVNKKPMGQL